MIDTMVNYSKEFLLAFADFLVSEPVFPFVGLAMVVFSVGVFMRLTRW